MRKVLHLIVEVSTFPLLCLLFLASAVGRGAHNFGRFIVEAVDEVEDWSKRNA